MGMEIGTLAVWVQQDDGGVNSLFSSSFIPGSSWSAREPVEDDGENARTPVLCMDGLGFAITAWVRGDGTNTDIWANTYDPSTGWATAGGR